MSYAIRHQFHLFDFNDETLQHTKEVLEDVKATVPSQTKIEVVKKSVHQVLRKQENNLVDQKYDFIYCAGLFDYLSDRICKRLMNIFYDMLEPDGFLVATNIHASNPSATAWNIFLDWHLIHRNRAQLSTLSLI